MFPEHIDIRDIVIGHFRTLRHAQADSVDIATIMLMLVVPMALGVGLGMSGWPSEAVITTLVSSVAIVTGLLLNVLVLIHGLYARLSGEGDANKAIKLARQTHSNIAFALLCAIVALAVLLALASDHIKWNPGFVATLRCIASALLMLVLLTLLIIVRRVHALIAHDMSG